MKKQVLSILLALCLCLTLPTTALADTDTGSTTHADHCICGATHTSVGNHTEENKPFTGDNCYAISTASQLLATGTVGGTYYLTADVTITSSNLWRIGSITGRFGCTADSKVDITLCLNGHTITLDNSSNNDGNGCILIENGSLTITDCGGNGKITGVAYDDTIKGNEKGIVVACWSQGCTFNLYGGTITGITVNGGSESSNYKGGGVYNEGVFNMYGGKITGNKAYNGGGVYNSANYQGGKAGNAVFNLYGGSISDNTSTASYSTGVYIGGKNGSNTVTMNANGGTVSGTVYNWGTIATADGYDGTTFTGDVSNAADGTISGGTFNDTVDNSGTITGGTFNGRVDNNGTIDNGTFNGTVTNSYYITGGTFGSTSIVLSIGGISGGTFNGVVYKNEEITESENLHIGTQGSYYPDVYFGTTASSDNGYTWNPDTKTLTLAKVYVGGLKFADELVNADITIVIDGTVVIDTLSALSESSGKMTIQGKTGRNTDTLKCSSICTQGKDLTLSGLNVTCDSAIYVCKSTGSGAESRISDCGTLTLNNCTMTMQSGSGSTLAANEIKMDDSSVLTLKNCSIANNGTGNKVTTDELKDFLPTGVTIGLLSEGGGISKYGFSKGETTLTEVTLQRNDSNDSGTGGDEGTGDNEGTGDSGSGSGTTTNKPHYVKRAAVTGTVIGAADYTSGNTGLTFKSSASFASFQGVQVDGKTIDSRHYIAEAGSIEVYLKATYLQTLAAGKHTVTILSTEGNVTMDFTVGGVTSAKTFDAGAGIYAVTALLSYTGTALVIRGRKKS